MKSLQKHPYWWDDPAYKAVQRAEPAEQLPVQLKCLLWVLVTLVSQRH